MTASRGFACLLVFWLVPAARAGSLDQADGNPVEIALSFLPEHVGLLVVAVLLLALLIGAGIASIASLQLAASRARLASALEASDVGIWEWHVPSGRVTVDHSWASMIGYTRDEIEQDISAWRSLVHPEDLPRFQEALERHVHGHDDRYQIELRLRHRSGEWVWIRGAGQVVERGRDGQPIFMRGTQTDITMEKARDAKLAFIARRDRVLLLLPQASEDHSEHEFAQAALQRLEDLTSSSISFLHFIHEPAGQVELLAWSPRTEQQYCHVVNVNSHYPLSEGGIWVDAVQSRKPQIINDYGSAANRRGLPRGHAVMERFIAVPFIDYGRVVMLVGIGNKPTDYVDQDVETVQLFTNEIWRLIQRARNQTSLRQASMVFEHACEGIMVTDAEHRIVDVNPAFEKISGYARSEVLGETPLRFRSGPQGSDFYQHLWSAVEENDMWEGEVWNRRKNGSAYPQYLHLSVIRDANGKVVNHVALFSDISLQKAQQDELQRLAHYDSLTGLPNRVLFTDRLQQAMAQVVRHGRCLAIAFMDLDGFKEVNDAYGHDTGDEILIEIAARFDAALRTEDTIARLGGDEFVAIVSDFDDFAAVRPLFDRLLAAASAPLTTREGEMQVSVSIGVSIFPRRDNADLEPDQLLREADQAMYQAKKSGRNRLAFFSGTPGAECGES